MPMNATRAAAASVDLRRTNSHPDYWYPVAWSQQVKPGKMLACSYAEIGRAHV